MMRIVKQLIPLSTSGRTTLKKPHMPAHIRVKVLGRGKNQKTQSNGGPSDSDFSSDTTPARRECP